MPFFHVDDGFHGHKKLARLGIEDFHAIALWTVAGSWSSDNLEDGFVPDYIAARMHPDYKEFANALVRVGLWEVAEKGGEAGWQFHDWTGPGRNPSAEQVHKERAANAERQREFRSRVKGTKPKGEEPPEPPEPQGWAPPDPPMNDGGSNGVTEPLVTDGVRDPVPFRSVPLQRRKPFFVANGFAARRRQPRSGHSALPHGRARRACGGTADREEGQAEGWPQEDL